MLVMVFSPHPDDEAIACGGTILKRRAAGHRVVTVFSTDGSRSHAAVLGIHVDPTPQELAAIRRTEAEEAAALLGMDPGDVHFLGFEDTRLADSMPEFRAAVAEILSAHREVTDVYLPHEVRELNADHRLTGEGVLACLAELGLHPRVHRFVVWDEQTEAEFVFVNRRPADHPPAENERLVEEDVSAQVPGKLAALAAHRTQVTLYTAAQTRPVVPPEFIERVCTRPTESFWISTNGSTL